MSEAYFVNVIGNTDLEDKGTFCIDDCTFVIPTYQRGFRWRKQQMKELCDDLVEFEDNDDQETYLMQPVTVRFLKDKSYEVADGQQRLTAIWIIRQLKALLAGTDKPLYSLKYEEKAVFSSKIKKLEKAIREIKDNNTDKEKRIDKFNTFLEGFKKCNGDIDAWHFVNAVNYLWTDKDLNFKGIADKHFFTDTNKKYQFIWHDMHSDGKSDGEERNEIISKFIKLNSRKIPLTDAEIIKALFYRYLPEERKALFSFRWEEIENQLSDDSFWGFLVPSKTFDKYETRIDFLFNVYLKCNTFSSNDYLVSGRIKDIIGTEGAEKVWDEIVDVFNTFRMWYSDYYFFHLIGLYTELKESGESTPQNMGALVQEFKKIGKKEFSNSLKKKIRDIVFSGKDTDPTWDDSYYKEINLDAVRYMDEKGNSPGKKHIKPVLLTFNIALLLNAYAINAENGAERFPFEYYKTHTIEIEHINAKHLEGKIDGADITNAKKIDWAQDVISVVKDMTTETTGDELEKKLEEIEAETKTDKDVKLDDKNDKWTKFVAEIEEKADLHSINNLTLLDRDVNNKYRDSQYVDKAPHIAAARFGFPIPVKKGNDYEEKDPDGSSQRVEIKIRDISSVFEKSSGIEIGLNKELIEDAKNIEIKYIPDNSFDFSSGKTFVYSFGTVTYSGNVNNDIITDEYFERNDGTCFKAEIPVEKLNNKTFGTNSSYCLTVKEKNGDDVGETVFCKIVISGYSNSVIFPGTMWVFMRQYIERADIVGTKKAYWTKADRDHYEEYIKRSLWLMLKTN